MESARLTRDTRAPSVTDAAFERCFVTKELTSNTTTAPMIIINSGAIAEYSIDGSLIGVADATWAMRNDIDLTL